MIRPSPLLRPPYVTAMRRKRNKRGFDVTHNDPSKGDPSKSGKEADKYGGMVEFDMTLAPSVIICGAAGAVLGLILARWGTTEIPIIIATVIVFVGHFWLFRPLV